MAKTSLHLTEINGIEYFFRTTDGLYEGAISNATGITRATTDEQDRPALEVAELIQKGILIKVQAKATLSNGRSSTFKILVARDMLATALDALANKTYSITNGSSGTIKSVNFSTRVVSRG